MLYRSRILSLSTSLTYVCILNEHEIRGYILVSIRNQITMNKNEEILKNAIVVLQILMRGKI